MSNHFQLVALTTGQMSSFAQLEDGPFGQEPPLRSFWCGELSAHEVFSDASQDRFWPDFPRYRGAVRF